MTDQEVFERVYRHLMKQGYRSFVQTPRGQEWPLYYGEGGARCAVGCLIPVHEYDRKFESLRLEQVQGRCPSLWGLNLNLLFALRSCHDDLFAGRWKKRLATIAEQFHLIVSDELKALRLSTE